MKRILIVLGIFVIAGGVVALGILLSRSGSPAPVDPGGAVPAGTLPLPSGGNAGTGTATGTGGGTAPGATTTIPGTGGAIAAITAVSQMPILDYAVNASGTLFMADTSAGLVEASSSQAVVNQGGFADVSGAWFSPDAKWLLVRSGGADAPRWSLLDVNKRAWKDVQANATAMYWSPTGNLLAYFARRTDGITLSIYDVQRGTTKSVLRLAAIDMVLQWQGQSRIFIMDRPSANVAGNVWNVDVAKGTASVFASDVRGADMRWGGARGVGLFFTAGGTGGNLSLVNPDGTANAKLSFLTLASKCVFGDVATATTTEAMGDYLFCALPQDAAVMRNYQLPDDYLRKKFGTKDVWYAINTLTGAFETITAPSQTFSFDATNPKLYGEDLYFMNRNDQRLYRVPTAGVSVR